MGDQIEVLSLSTLQRPQHRTMALPVLVVRSSAHTPHPLHDDRSAQALTPQ